MLFAVAGGVQAAPKTFEEEGAVGEAFGKPVSPDEYAYFNKTAQLLTRSGKAGQRGEDEIREETWQDLVFTKEALREGLKIERVELDAELKRLVSQQGVDYGTPKYAAWVVSAFHEDAKTFERRVEDLLRINAFLRQHSEPAITVSDEEVQEKFLNEGNAFESEYIHFDTLEEAERFAGELRQDPSPWKPTFDRKRTEAGQKGAAWINVMTIEALVDLWKIPKEDAARIHDADEGAFVVGNNYYGPAVFRLLTKQSTTLDKLDQKQQDMLRQRMLQGKRYQIVKGYFDDLMNRAKIRDYQQEHAQEEKRRQEAAQAKQAAEALRGKTSVLLETEQGTIELKLWPEVAPKACENFIKLVEKGYYNTLTFHRVIKDFMIQGGDPNGNGTGGESAWGKPFEDEVKDDVKFDRPGLLAMANSGPNTNGSQFFITTVPTPHLNGKHTIFGEVVAGMDVVHKIETAPKDSADKPLTPQHITKASIKPASAAPASSPVPASTQ